MMTGDHHGRPHRRGLRGPARHHAGERGDRRPATIGHLARGVPGAAADARPDADDAAALRSMPTSWASSAARSSASPCSTCRRWSTSAADQRICDHDPLRHGPDQERRLRRPGRPGGLPARHAVRAQRLGAVGEATTSAVVTGIVCIVVADAIITVIFDVLASECPGHGPTPRPEAPHIVVERPHHGLRRASCIQRDLNFTVRPGRRLHHHGRQRLRQEHPAAPPDRPAAPGRGRESYDGDESFWDCGAGGRASASCAASASSTRAAPCGAP